MTEKRLYRNHTLWSYLAVGRTTWFSTRASLTQVEALADQYGRMRMEGIWSRLTTTQKLDVIATSILVKDRARRVQQLRASDDYQSHRQSIRKQMFADVRGDFLSPWQFLDRRRHELYFHDFSFLDRNFTVDVWRWHDGGWYGDFLQILRELYPKEFDDGVSKGPTAGLVSDKPCHWAWVQQEKKGRQSMVVEAEQTKVCSKCAQSKDINEFTRDSRSKDGHRADCKGCRNKRASNQQQGGQTHVLVVEWTSTEMPDLRKLFQIISLIPCSVLSMTVDDEQVAQLSFNEPQ